jgi:hypothetical protein
MLQPQLLAPEGTIPAMTISDSLCWVFLPSQALVNSSSHFHQAGGGASPDGSA